MANVTHIRVKNNLPPARPIMTVGRLYPCGSETVFRTHTPNFVENEETDAEAAEPINETETKVVKPRNRRGRRPVAQADTKGAEAEAE